jgi:hypothetical protein
MPLKKGQSWRNSRVEAALAGMPYVSKAGVGWYDLHRSVRDFCEG